MGVEGVVIGDTLVLLEPAQWSPAERENHFCQKVFVCVGWDMGEVSKRKDILALICKMGEFEHTFDWVLYNLPIEELNKY